MKRIALIAILVAEGILFAQTPNGVITGRIVGSEGKPAAGERVAAALSNATGQVATDTLVAISRTDANGNYRIENVPPGRYGIVAGVMEAPTYYPGTVDVAAAKMVSVSSGATLDGMNFTILSPSAAQIRQGQAEVLLRGSAAAHLAQESAILSGAVPPPAGVGWVSGRIVIDGEHQLPDSRIFIAAEYLSVSGFGAVGTSVFPDGTFRFRVRVFVGDLVRIRVASADSSELPADYYLKSISDGTLDLMENPVKLYGAVAPDILIRLGVGQRVSGTVHQQNGQPASNMTLTLLPRRQAERGRLDRTAKTDQNGAFELRGVAAGEYAISTSAHAGAASISISHQSNPQLNLIVTSDRLILAGPPPQ